MCVKFTPKQYMKLYESGLLYANNEPLSTSEAVLISLVHDQAAKKWLATKDSITTTLTEPPNPSDCSSAN